MTLPATTDVTGAFAAALPEISTPICRHFLDTRHAWVLLEEWGTRGVFATTSLWPDPN